MKKGGPDPGKLLLGPPLGSFGLPPGSSGLGAPGGRNSSGSGSPLDIHKQKLRVPIRRNHIGRLMRTSRSYRIEACPRWYRSTINPNKKSPSTPRYGGRTLSGYRPVVGCLNVGDWKIGWSGPIIMPPSPRSPEVGAASALPSGTLNTGLGPADLASSRPLPKGGGKSFEPSSRNSPSMFSQSSVVHFVLTKPDPWSQDSTQPDQQDPCLYVVF